MIYIFLVLYSMTFAFSWIETSKSKDSIVIYIYMLMVFLLLCFFAWFKPLGLGFDDKHYYSVLVMQYQNMNYGISNPFGWESGYIYLNYISTLLFDDSFGALSFLVILISMMLNIYGFRKLAPIIGIPILWYLSHLFLYKEITQLRSAIAYAILFVSFFYIYEKKFLVAFFIVLLASCFHVSAIIGLVAFFVRLVSLRFLFFVLLSSIVLSIFGVWNFLASFLSFLLPPIVYNTYVLDTTGFAKSVGLLNPTTLKYILLCLFFYYMRKRAIFSELYDYSLKLYMLSPIWLVVFSSFGTLAGRPASIFAIMEGVLLAHVVCASSHNGLLQRFIASIFCCCLLLINLFFIRPINLSIF
ncbi:EpsG family protein [Vibrio splendidus]|uniref:EpsG family protein n=1 Tax=Vibrio splendidus TaxID=29497 RepID=UPI000D355D25|nr:EpsG family protein [Vibrio splendidus]PTO65218.1 hypothetical protein CWN99_08835 [Vibrio splendidus]